MSIIKWHPLLDPFNEFLSDARFMPPVNVYEESDAVIVEAPLAGIDPDKVDISVENDILTIQGESEKKTEVDEQNYYRQEIRMGSFYRSVQLPAHVDGARASAISENGMIKIAIPKKETAKKQKIKIEKK